MDINSFKKALPSLLQHKIVPFLWGSQGVGKTQSVYQYAKENGLELVVLHTATQEVGDLIGLLAKNDDTGIAYHTRPEWFPTGGRGIVFLDELNRAPVEVIQALFPFVTEGKLHRHTLPEGWHVVAAGNYQSDRFNVTDTSDDAWLSRFCHIDFRPTTAEFLVYAGARHANEVANFIREQPTMLELSAKIGGSLDTSFIKPDRRSWIEAVSKLDNDSALSDEIRYELYVGLVGTAAAAAYMSFRAKAERSLSLDDILSDYSKVRKTIKKLSVNDKEVRFDLLNQPIDELVVHIESSPAYLSADGYLVNLKEFLADIPLELATKAFVRLGKIATFHGREALLNDPEYVKKFVA